MSSMYKHCIGLSSDFADASTADAGRDWTIKQKALLLAAWRHVADSRVDAKANGAASTSILRAVAAAFRHRKDRLQPIDTMQQFLQSPDIDLVLRG